MGSFRFDNGVTRIEDYNQGRELTRLAVSLTLHLFIRSSKLRFARWSEIDFRNKIWTIPAAREAIPGVRHRPDGIITLSSGAIVAVETERSMKTRARYISIVNSHLAASDAGRWHYAMYVMQNNKTKIALISAV